MSESVLETLPTVYRKFSDFTGGLARLLMQRNLFPAGHPSVAKSLETAMASLEGLFQGDRPVAVRRTGGALRYLNFEVDTTQGGNEIHMLRKALLTLAVEEIEFHRGIEPDELLAFVEIASAAMRRDTSVDLSASWMRISNIAIRRVPPSTIARVEEGGPAYRSSRRIRPAREDNAAAGGGVGMPVLIGGVLRNLSKIDSLEGEAAGRAILRMIERGGSGNLMVLLLRSLKEYDEYTFDHSVNVAIISTAIAKRLGYGDEETAGVGMAALMHDMGKIYVPREIIHKSGRLTPREWILVKRHPIDGERILREEGADYLTRRVAYEHHMRYDGKGYPMPRDGERCLEASHIVRIADSYDALTTRRRYRKQISPFEAIRLMEQGKGSEFHPGYFDVFLQVLGNIPVGSVLVLQGGEKVLVVEVGAEGRRPRVRLLCDAEGNEPEREIVLDLAEIDPGTGSFRHRIAAVLENPVRDVDVRRYLVDSGSRRGE